MIVHPTVHLLIAATLTTSPTGDMPPCTPSDHRCTADANVAAARATTSPSERVQYLYRAHRAFLALARKAPPAERVRPLCRAAELLGEARALPPPAALRQPLLNTVKETADALESEGVDCSPRKARRHVARQPVARRTSATATAAAGANKQEPTNGSQPEQLLPAEETQPSHVPDTEAPAPAGLSPALAQVDDETRPVRIVEAAPSALEHEVRPPDLGLMPVPTSRAPVRSGRGLVIAGGATLGVGLALAGVAGYMGGRTLDARRQAAALAGMVDVYADDAQLARDQQLTRDYELRGTKTLALALAGGATIVVAAVLLGVGGRRLARVATRTSLAPVPGGLVFRARF